MKWMYVVMTLFGGLAIGVQSPINGALGKRIGGIEGAFVSFLVGTISLLGVLLFLGKGNLGDVFNLPKGMLIGGFLGAIFVTCNIIAVPRIGVTAAISSAILGQILAGMVIDHFGLLGIPRNPINLSRIFGIVLMLGGLYLVLKRDL